MLNFPQRKKGITILEIDYRVVKPIEEKDGLKILIISTKWGKRRTCVSVITRNVNGPKLIMRPNFYFQR